MLIARAIGLAMVSTDVITAKRSGGDVVPSHPP
jgi:hypothetical protein